MKSDPDFIDKLSELKDSYRAQVISNADSALKSNGYKDAIQIIEDGLDILPNDSELLAKIDEYEEYKPISIKSFTVTASNNGYDFYSSRSDPRGEVNTDVLYLESYVEFYIGGKYSKLVATVDPDQNFRTSIYAGTQLKIYADDELVYSSPTITYKTDDLEISVDIKNANYIRFQLVYVGGTAHIHYWNADEILIYNAYVSK